MACSWDPNKHGGKPCPIHGANGNENNIKPGTKVKNKEGKFGKVFNVRNDDYDVEFEDKSRGSHKKEDLEGIDEDYEEFDPEMEEDYEEEDEVVEKPDGLMNDEEAEKAASAVAATWPKGKLVSKPIWDENGGGWVFSINDGKKTEQHFQTDKQLREWLKNKPVNDIEEDRKGPSYAELEADNMNPNNPKYEGFKNSDITNAKEVDEGYTFTDSEGKEQKMSIIEYIPYGALKDGDNRKLYGVVTNYDGSETPKTGAIVSVSLDSAKDDLERQVKLAIQGSNRYMKQGQFDEDFFNILRDYYDENDPEDAKTRANYSKNYGWDYNKPFAEHDFMKDDPYEKWKSAREENKLKKQNWSDEELDEAIDKHDLMNITPEFRDAILRRLGERLNNKKD